ncbi:unnamed protein product [Rotaria socialis]
MIFNLVFVLIIVQYHSNTKKSLGSLWHHQGSSWSREQLLAAHLDLFKSKFHSTIQFNSIKTNTNTLFK